jgi:hypothetical protein
MPSKRLFNRRYGKRAFARLRSMLEDPSVAYQHIANKFGLTRQYIAKIAKELGIDGIRRRRQRERERMLRREPRVIKADYPPGIRAVINKIRHSGNQVRRHIFPPSQANVAWKSQKMVVMNGVLCTIQLRKGSKKGPNSGEYARFDVNREVRRAKVALWAMRSSRRMRLYVIPLSHLRNVSSVYIPVEGKYAVGNSHRPARRDWTRYEGAWHLLRGGKVRTNSSSPQHEIHG